MPSGGNPNDSSKITTKSVSRRNYLLASVASSSFLLAGCQSSPENSETTNEGEGNETTNEDEDNETTNEDNGSVGSDNSDEAVFITGGRIPQPIDETNYNIWSPRVRDDIAVMRFGFRDHNTEEYVSERLGGPLTDWEYDRGNQATLHIKENLVWQDSTKHTAQDFVTGFQLVKEALGDEIGIWTAAEGVSANGDWTIQIDLANEYSEDLFWSNIFGEGARINPANTRDDIHREYLEKIQDASTEDEKAQAQQELSELSIKGNPPETGATAWKPVNHTSTYVEYELFDEHPYAENINWEKARMITEPAKAQHGIEYLKSNDLHLLKQTLDESILGTLPENIRTDTIPKPQLTTVLFNNQHEYLGRRKVRQAFAYLINRETASQTVFPPAPNPIEHLVGFGPTAGEKWLDGIRDSLIPYEYNPEKAATLLEEEGFSKEGGTWMTPDGDPFKLSFLEIQFPNLRRTVKAVNPFINDFGIQTELLSKSGEQMWSQHYNESDYEITVGPHGGMGQPHPYVSFQRIFDNNIHPSIAATEEYGYPENIGDLESSMKTAVPMDLVSQIPSASEEEAIELVQELAWMFNYNLPQLSIMRRTLHSHYQVGDWDVASADTSGMTQSRAAVTAMQNGLISKK